MGRYVSVYADMTIQHLPLFKALSDTNRLRALLVLREAELTVGELGSILALAQSSVSSLLRTLTEAELLTVRRSGRRAFYRGVSSPLVSNMLRGLDIEDSDRDALQCILRSRQPSHELALASEFERAEVAGRSWQSLARGLLLISRFGIVADFGVGSGHLTMLLAERAQRIYAVDRDAKRLLTLKKRAVSRGVDLISVQSELADAVLPETVDLCTVSLVLSSNSDPHSIIRRAAGCLAEDGVLWLTALASHSHETIQQRLGHAWPGIPTELLVQWVQSAGLEDINVVSGGRERRAPRLESHVLVARRRKVAA